MEPLYTLKAQSFEDIFNAKEHAELTHYLERGQVLYLPQLSFSLLPEETSFLTPQYADPKTKNIGYHDQQKTLWGVQRLTDKQHTQLKRLLSRFCAFATQLIHQTFPSYQTKLITGRTSYRPVEISGRKTSYRKDDKRLHVDAFPANPNQGKRILRVFCNINPEGKARVWRLGEPFSKVVEQFHQKFSAPLLGKSFLLRLLKITKSYRTLYDHYMLQLHDLMKADTLYQQNAEKLEIAFPSACSWIVQTDHVSHAAMSGQYLLEQTFYLPVDAMQEPNYSPLRILEKKLQQELV